MKGHRPSLLSYGPQRVIGFGFNKNLSDPPIVFKFVPITFDSNRGVADDSAKSNPEHLDCANPLLPGLRKTRVSPKDNGPRRWKEKEYDSKL